MFNKPNLGNSGKAWSAARPLRAMLATCICYVTVVLGFGAELTDSVRLLTPSILEWERREIVGLSEVPASSAWFPENGSGPVLPGIGAWVVGSSGAGPTVTNIHGSRQVVRAEHSVYEMELVSRLWLWLDAPLTGEGSVSISHPDVGDSNAQVGDGRTSPAIHWNRAGYQTGASKVAYIHRYLGAGGDLQLPVGTPFRLTHVTGGGVAFQGVIENRADVGFLLDPLPYQTVGIVDFSGLDTPGHYQIEVDGLGVAGPVQVTAHALAAKARLAALGLYHQRSGTDLTLPFTRFIRGAGHLEPAAIPGIDHPTNPLLAASSADALNDPNHTAPVLTNVVASLYPVLRSGPVDVSGGHHDAGDYSKYTINSAHLVHGLRVAAEHFPGAGDRDDLGLPESGDGMGDLWQMAAWEADFLVKMQDLDGGFHFLVYPENRRYEHDVLPEDGDLQVLWPKNTAATAAAVGALAEMGGAPAFRAHNLAKADAYLAAAVSGWQFLTNAISTHGSNGAYQKLTHYGHGWFHDDEMAWAAAALFAATGDPTYDSALRSWMPDPESPSIRQWTWMRLSGGWGNAIRIYALMDARPGAGLRDATYLAACRSELLEAARDQALWAEQSAFGVSYPEPSKRFQTAGWFFPQSAALDLFVGLLQSADPLERAEFRQSIASNLGYVHGANPADVIHVTGYGVNSPLNPVMQVADNDRRRLPPSGYPTGAIASGLSWLGLYGQTIQQRMFPSYGTGDSPFPIYDRFTDVFNTTTEPTVIEMGRSMAVLAGLWADHDPVGVVPAPVTWELSGLPEVWEMNVPVELELVGQGIDWSTTRVIWEMPDSWHDGGSEWTVVRETGAASWIEVEIILEDGRRLFGVYELESFLEPPVLEAMDTVVIQAPQRSVGVEVIAQAGHPEVTLSYTWSRVSGPGSVDFTDPLLATTHVSFSDPGVHVLSVTVSDGTHEVEGTVTVTVLGEFEAATPGGSDETTLCISSWDAGGNEVIGAVLEGEAEVVTGAQFWASDYDGGILRSRDLGDAWVVSLDDMITTSDLRPVTVEGRVLFRGYKAWGQEGAPLLSLKQAWDSSIEIFEDKWASNKRPMVRAGNTVVLANAGWDEEVHLGEWVHVAATLDPTAQLASFWVNGVKVAETTATVNEARVDSWILTVGHADADWDEVRVHRGVGPWQAGEPGGGNGGTPYFGGQGPEVWGATRWFSLDGSWEDDLDETTALIASGGAGFETLSDESRQVGYFTGYGSRASTQLTDAEVDQGLIRFGAWIYPESWSAWGVGGTQVISLYQSWDAQLELYVDKWKHAPEVWMGSQRVVNSTVLGGVLTLGEWHYIEFEAEQVGSTATAWATVRVDGVLLTEIQVPFNWQRTASWNFEVGNFLGSIADVALGH